MNLRPHDLLQIIVIPFRVLNEQGRDVPLETRNATIRYGPRLDMVDVPHGVLEIAYKALSTHQGPPGRLERRVPYDNGQWFFVASYWCQDCGVQIDDGPQGIAKIEQQLMAGAKEQAGMRVGAICLECLADRLGRAVALQDLTPHPGNEALLDLRQPCALDELVMELMVSGHPINPLLADNVQSGAVTQQAYEVLATLNYSVPRPNIPVLSARWAIYQYNAAVSRQPGAA